VDNFIREQCSACFRATHELRQLGETDYQNYNKYFESFFTDDNHPTLQSELSEPTQLPDSTTLIERGIINGLLERPTSEVNGIVLTLGPAEDDSHNQSSQQQISSPSPPLVISISLAIKYIAELQQFYQALYQQKNNLAFCVSCAFDGPDAPNVNSESGCNLTQH